MTYITCDMLSIGYEGTAIAENLCFSVKKGEFLCIVGENGAGKSTLIKTMLHLMEPLQGEIIFGDNLQGNEVGYLPQIKSSQKDFPATVWEIVLSGTLTRCGKRPFYRREEKEMAQENLKRMGIWELRKKCYRNLSGGQQQRVLLARALCATSKLLILDEPVTGLDPLVTKEFYQVVKELNESGITIIMVSHDMEQAVKHSTHILHMGKRQLFFGKKEDYLQSNLWTIFGNVKGENA